MDHQHPLPLTAEALSETLVASSNAAVLEFLQHLNLSESQISEQDWAEPFKVLVAPGINLGYPNPESWSFPTLNKDNDGELLTLTDEYGPHGVGCDPSPPETLTNPYSQGGSYTNVSDEQSHPGHSEYSGSDWGYPSEGPESTIHPVISSHPLDVQPTQAPETSITKKFRKIVPRPLGQLGTPNTAGDQGTVDNPGSFGVGQDRTTSRTKGGGRKKGSTLPERTLRNGDRLRKIGGTCLHCKLYKPGVRNCFKKTDLWELLMVVLSANRAMTQVYLPANLARTNI